MDICCAMIKVAKRICYVLSAFFALQLQCEAVSNRSLCSRPATVCVCWSPGAPQKLGKSHWCVPFTATFSKRRKIGASWSERCDGHSCMSEQQFFKKSCKFHWWLLGFATTSAVQHPFHCWQQLASWLPLEKFCYGWLYRRPMIAQIAQILRIFKENELAAAEAAMEVGS